MKWSEGQRTGDENAPTAASGCPNLNPGIFPPDINTKNLTFGTLVRAFPYKRKTKNNSNHMFHSSKARLKFNLTVPNLKHLHKKNKTNYSKQGRI